MAHKKIQPNIYYDDRCTNMPYFVNIMRRGNTLYKKFATLDEAVEAKDKFIEKHSTSPTEHPFVFKRNNQFIIEVLVEKSYNSLETAIQKANILQRFIEN